MVCLHLFQAMYEMGAVRKVKTLRYTYNLERVPGNEDPFVREIFNEQFDEELLDEINLYARSGYSEDMHREALLKYDKTLTDIKNVGLRMESDPVIQRAIARVKEDLRPALEDLETLTAHELKCVRFKGGSAAGHTYSGKKRDNWEEALRRASKTINAYPGVVSHGGIFRFTAAKAFARNHLSTIENPKLRHVWGYPFHITLIEGLVAQPIIEALMKEDSPIYIGKNIYRDMPRDITLLSDCEDATFYGFDFSSFDSSVVPWIIDAMFDILADLVHVREPIALEIARTFFQKTPLLMPNGDLYIVETGVPSGSMFTQLIDSMVNLTLIYAFADYFELRNLSPVKVLGDDSAFWSTTLVDKQQAADFFAQYGMTLNPEKSIVTRNFDELYFLGHHFLGHRVTRDEFTLLALALYPEDPVANPGESLLRVAGLLIDSGLNSIHMASLLNVLEYRHHLDRRDLNILSVSDMFHVLD